MASNEERATLVSAMSKDERLLQTSFVRLDIEDPASANAQWCLEQYFAELDERHAVLAADCGGEVGAVQRRAKDGLLSVGIPQKPVG